MAYRLYLPEDWASDAVRRRKAHVPEEIGFKTKPEIALEQIRAACDAGLPRGVVLMDAGYGVKPPRLSDSARLIGSCPSHGDLDRPVGGAQTAARPTMHFVAVKKEGRQAGAML